MWGIKPQAFHMQSKRSTTLATSPVLVMGTSSLEDHVDMNKQQKEDLHMRGLKPLILFDVVFYILM